MIIPIDFATPAYDEAVALRDKILRKPLGLEFSIDYLRREYMDVHLAYYENARILACLVLTKKNKSVIQMRQVAVEKDLQSKGVGTALVIESECVAKKSGYKKMILHARDEAVPFYKKLKYKKVGKPFEEVGIKHYEMEKVL